jgi:hypothetical protein
VDQDQADLCRTRAEKKARDARGGIRSRADSAFAADLWETCTDSLDWVNAQAGRGKVALPITAPIRFDALSRSGVVLASATTEATLLSSVRTVEVAATIPDLAPEVAARISTVQASWVYGR